MFAGSPVKRTGRNRFLRNVLIAIGNAEPGDPGLSPRLGAASTTPRRWSAPPRSGPSPGWRPNPTRPSAPAGSPVSRIRSSARNGSAIQPDFEHRASHDGCARRIRPAQSAPPSATDPSCEDLSALALTCLLIAGCTPYIPVKDEFSTSALKPTGTIPPEFAEFNNYDPRSTRCWPIRSAPRPMSSRS